MVRHMVIWETDPAADAALWERSRLEAKRRLEAMVGEAPGLLSMQVYTAPLPGSNASLALVADFTDAAALAAYQAWPPHVEVAKTLIKPMVRSRLCLDTELPD